MEVPNFFHYSFGMLRMFMFIILEGASNAFHNSFLCPRNVAHLNGSLENKIVVVTGSTNGIGLETVKAAAEKGATVIMACRNLKKGQIERENILKTLEDSDKAQHRLHIVELDLSSLDSVKKAVAVIKSNYERVDVLINNGGIMKCPESRSVDGYEMHLATNHLGHFQLTLGLLSHLERSPSPRVVTVSSSANLIGHINFDNLNLEGCYDPLNAYAQSKLANVLFSAELGRRYPKIATYSLHPGMVRTGIYHLFPLWQRISITAIKYLFMVDSQNGVQTTLFCAFDERCQDESGNYYSNCRKKNSWTSHWVKTSDAHQLWQVSVDLCQKV